VNVHSNIAKEQVCVPLKFGLVLQKMASFQVTIFITCQCFFCQPLHTLHLFTASTGHKTSSFGILNAVTQQVQVASFQFFLCAFSMQDWSLKCFDEITSFSQCFGRIPLTIPGIPFWTFSFFVWHSACLQGCIMSFVITGERYRLFETFVDFVVQKVHTS